MQKPAKKNEQPQTLKKRLMAALAMLLVATTLMTTTSYAWFVLSTAPEVTGITTNVGANGSLEIALLNTETRSDMSLIRAGIGDSLAANNLSANNAWGNLVDLGFVNYGLGSLMLLPARLDANPSGEDYKVNDGLLAVPTYGYDGRIVDLTHDGKTAIYLNDSFTYSAGAQDYGVRAVGTANGLSAQASALNSAQSNIPTFTKNAKDLAQKALKDHGNDLFQIVVLYAQNREASSFDDDDKAVLVGMLDKLENSIHYIEQTLRQGLVAFAAAAIADEDTFVTVRDYINNNSNTLTDILTEMANPDYGITEIPTEFASWVSKLDTMQQKLDAAQNACVGLSGNDYSWTQFEPIISAVMNVNYIRIDGMGLRELNITELMGSSAVEMALIPGSGLYVDIADYVDNYDTVISFMNIDITITTLSSVNPKHLAQLKTVTSNLTPAGGAAAASAPLDATYGYAIDLAFRCNAAEPDLLLQTTPKQRVYTDSESGSTQGGGSFMEFSSRDELLTLEQKLQLMDGIRVGFLDNEGVVLGIAKLNVSNRTTENGMVQAPLYLYDYELTQDDHGMYLTMGERRRNDEEAGENTQNKIVDLEQNVAKAITVLVWLDGDVVDNTMVSATEAASLNGVLNLQFTTSAGLVPATDGTLLNYTAGNKTDLDNLVLLYSETYNAGQGIYTDVSWSAFSAAYTRANDVSYNANAGVIEINNAMNALITAHAELADVTEVRGEVEAKIAELRDLMGTTDQIAGYAINENGVYKLMGHEGATQAQLNEWAASNQGEIRAVNYQEKNLVDEGNGVMTPIYTESSWKALANALYAAEAVVLNANAPDSQLNQVLTAMDSAHKGLTRKVHYKAYELDGVIYYEGISDAERAEEENDTYGKWYDSNFNRVVSDVTILKLDGGAQEVDIAKMGQDSYVSREAPYITPDIAFLSEDYPELKDVEVKGVNWNAVDSTLFTELMSQSHYNQLKDLVDLTATDEVLTKYSGETYAERTACNAAVSAANGLITRFDNNEDVPVAGARTAIADLKSGIEALYKKNLEKDEENSTTMTAKQRTVLQTAVDNAKSLPNYDTNTALKSATEAAEAVLNQVEPAKTEAEAKLAALNTQLEAAGAEAVTEENALTVVLSDLFGEDDIVYTVEYPGIKLKLKGVSGTTTIGAQILTKDGVVINLQKELTIYDPANGLGIYNTANPEAQISSLTLAANGTANLKADLLYSLPAGQTPVKQQIVNYQWACPATDVIQITDGGDGTCTIKAVGTGTVTLSVSVETADGNNEGLAAELTITVG